MTSSSLRVRSEVVVESLAGVLAARGSTSERTPTSWAPMVAVIDGVLLPS
jgi:hypothetical protein